MEISLILTFQINVDAESLKLKRPNFKNLNPYPVTCYIEYKDHNDAVTSILAGSSGQWIASSIHIFLFSCHLCNVLGPTLINSFFFFFLLLLKQVQLMELCGFGRWQPVDVSVFGTLLLLSDKWHAIL